MIRITGQVLHLHVHPHAAAGLEGLGEVGHIVGDLVSRRLADQPPVIEVGIVVDDQHAVGRQADVQLNPVGPLRLGLLKRLHGVFPPVQRGTPVGDHQRSAVRPADDHLLCLRRLPTQPTLGRCTASGSRVAGVSTRA